MAEMHLNVDNWFLDNLGIWISVDLSFKVTDTVLTLFLWGGFWSCCWFSIFILW